MDEKIRKLDEQLAKHKDIIKKTRPGPAQEAAKRRALVVRRLASAASPALAAVCGATACRTPFANEGGACRRPIPSARRRWLRLQRCPPP